MKLASIGWSAAGLAAPLMVALMTVPPLLDRLGNERFGLLSLAWALTAISGLFDLGLGRATTRLVADQLGRGDTQAPRGTVAVALRFAAGAGMGGAALLALGTLLGLDRLLRLASVDPSEVRQALWLLALAIPLQTLIATYRGVSEACQQFRGISLLRMALGVANFAAPLAVAQFSTHLAALVAALLTARVLALLGFRHLALASLPPGPGVPLAASERRQLLHSGGWFTVSAIVSPLLVQADRFFIAALVSTAAVASYTVPFDIITQLLIGVTAVSTVAFPSITHLLRQGAGQARQQFRRWLWRVVVVMALLCLSVALVLPVVLPLWVGNALPPEAITVGRWLCLGVWINAIGSMHFAWLHAQGRFRATALLHVLELPLYIVLLMVLLARFGVVGAAMAWTARVALDTAGLAWLAGRKV
ncbi:MAG: oligosaccharide flippase family protein [Rubrivivax sp.]|nr:oligosaccharide flippase family protein [Rubrivivax sp.]